MRKWVVEAFIGTDKELENKLNTLEIRGKKIKEILMIKHYDYEIENTKCKIIYTEEDIIEEVNK